MRIIKKGKPKDRLWRGKCGDCSSEIEAKQSEICAVEMCPVERNDFGRANCPVCGHGMVFYPVKESNVRSDHE